MNKIENLARINSENANEKQVWARPVIGYIDIRRTLSSGGSTVDSSGNAVGTSIFQ